MIRLLIPIAVIIIAVGGWFAYQNSGGSGGESLYAYHCENSMQFSLSPAEDYSWIAIFPGENATFPQQTLSYRDTVNGMRYMGSDVAIAGSNERVVLAFASATTSCTTAPGSESMDWNMDTTDIPQNLSLIVSESIIGAWEGTGETKFRREFKTDGTYVDTQGGKEISRGLWFAFTEKHAPHVSFPLEKNNVYFQLANSDGTVAYLKIASMTLAELVMVYMDRPGVLTFSLVQ